MPTDLCRYCGSTYDVVHGHTCTPLTTTTSTGGDHARDQVGVDPTGPATTEGGDAHEPTLDSEHSHGTAGAHVTGPAPADAEPAHPVWGYPFPGAGPPERLIGYRIDGRIYDPDDVEVVYEAADDEATPPGGAGPPDLDHAIQAAAGALDKGWVIQGELHRQHVARVAVEAAAPVLLQATRDRLAHADEGRQFAMGQAQEAFQQRDEARDRLADLTDTARAVLSCLHAGNVFTAESLLRHALDGPAAQEEGG